MGRFHLLFFLELEELIVRFAMTLTLALFRVLLLKDLLLFRNSTHSIFASSWRWSLLAYSVYSALIASWRSSWPLSYIRFEQETSYLLAS